MESPPKVSEQYNDLAYKRGALASNLINESAINSSIKKSLMSEVIFETATRS